MNKNNDPLRQILWDFGNWLCDRYGLDTNDRYKYTNWTKTQTIDPKFLTKAIDTISKRTSNEKPPTNILLVEYNKAIRGSKPLPKAECMFCGDKFEAEEMPEHAPYCSYYRTVVCKRDIYFHGGSDYKQKPLTQEIKAEVYDLIMGKYLEKDK